MHRVQRAWAARLKVRKLGMKIIFGLLWAVTVFSVLWWLAAKSLFPWIDKKREARDPEHWAARVSVGELLDGKSRDD